MKQADLIAEIAGIIEREVFAAKRAAEKESLSHAYWQRGHSLVS
jgi:hypothetical protein